MVDGFSGTDHQAHRAAAGRRPGRGRGRARGGRAARLRAAARARRRHSVGYPVRHLRLSLLAAADLRQRREVSVAAGAHDLPDGGPGAHPGQGRPGGAETGAGRAGDGLPMGRGEPGHVRVLRAVVLQAAARRAAREPGVRAHARPGLRHSQYVLEEAVPGPTDVGPANPHIHKLRFNVDVKIERNDLLFTLRSDKATPPVPWTRRAATRPPRACRWSPPGGARAAAWRSRRRTWRL